MTAVLRMTAPAPEMVLTKAALRAAAGLGLTNADLAKIIGVSEATVSRYKKDASTIAPSSVHGQLAMLLVRVFRSLDPLVGSDESKRKAWMHSVNKALHGTPSELIRSPEGLVRTLAYLDGMRASA